MLVSSFTVPNAPQEVQLGGTVSLIELSGTL
jgi:hypothetical protein